MRHGPGRAGASTAAGHAQRRTLRRHRPRGRARHTTGRGSLTRLGARTMYRLLAANGGCRERRGRAVAAPAPPARRPRAGVSKCSGMTSTRPRGASTRRSRRAWCSGRQRPECGACQRWTSAGDARVARPQNRSHEALLAPPIRAHLQSPYGLLPMRLGSGKLFATSIAALGCWLIVIPTSCSLISGVDAATHIGTGVVLPHRAATVRRQAAACLEDLPGWANTVIGDLLKIGRASCRERV